MKTAKRWLVPLVVLLLWIGFDLLRPIQSDLRSFDPRVVARLDQEMWRSYYEKKQLKLFFQLGKLMRKQFHAPFWRSQYIAYQAAKAAFVFKRGSNRNEYELALPFLERYYQSIHDMSSTSFSIQKAARTELEWWIIHRQRAEMGVGELERALRESVAAIYDLPAGSFVTYAHFRAEAMKLRDEQAITDGVSEAEWVHIKSLLDRSWLALHRAVNA
ncbi:MAG: hypothetical protein KTR30_03135 [Saprospiraceae bacterium]|nr:hypothetical protein [Saprospiraceae bacterium]